MPGPWQPPGLPYMVVGHPNGGTREQQQQQQPHAGGEIAATDSPRQMVHRTTGLPCAYPHIPSGPSLNSHPVTARGSAPTAPAAPAGNSSNAPNEQQAAGGPAPGGGGMMNSHGSFNSADAYTFVDQVGNLQSVPVVSRQQVLQELRYKQPSTTISGTELQSGADASPHRARHHHHSSASASSAAAAGATPRESALAAWLVPDSSHHGSRRYWALWTSLFTVVACFLFAFMAGGFGTYTQSPTFAAYNKGSSLPVQLQWGPQALLGWLRFWETTPLNSFDVGYLMNWGARYLPALASGEWWRLFSSICLHGSFGHLSSNMLVLVVLAVPLEHSYGPLRILVIFLASGLGGTFLSAAFEDPCFVYVGASGAVFGFIGLYLADIMLNFESMHKPVVRLALMLVSLGLTLGIEYAAAARSPLQRVSHMSHVGGLVAGLCVSFMFLPNLADRRWAKERRQLSRVGASIHARWSHGGAGSSASAASSVLSHHNADAAAAQAQQSCWRRNAWLYYCVWGASAFVMLFLFAALPIYVYRFRIPALQCPPLVQ